MNLLARYLQRVDWLLIAAAFVLFAFGISAIYSVELSRGAAEFTLIRKQAIALLLGLALAAVVTRTNYQLFRNYGRGLYFLGVLSLIAVLLFGRTLNGSTGWFVIGGFAFQPIEFMKLALIAELARYFGEHARRRFSWVDFGKSGLITLIPIGLAMLEPDLGGAMLLGAIWLVMVFFAGARWTHIGALVLVALAAFLLGWFVIFEDYQKERLMTFMNPASDPLDTGYNVTQAKIAIGAGGILGRGLGSGSQSQLRFLPEAQSDFVFAVIAEELGFLGVTVVIAAVALLLMRLLATARGTRDTFAAFLVLGVFALCLAQAVVHIGANLSLLPATGVALPFVSYGGSSLLLSAVALGVAQSVAVTVTPGRRAEGVVL
ncbi:rod shape-determining protein RodA [Candidatus Uhrbacteria bacterium]|nr:rod shape-determining protein RodA [Candidatus Uhrbacteria bacterium]